MKKWVTTNFVALSKWLIKEKKTSIWYPLIGAVPPLILALNKFNLPFMLTKWIKTQVEASPWITVLLLLAPVFVIAVSKALDRYEQRFSEGEGPKGLGIIKLLESIDEIVSSKLVRARKYFIKPGPGGEIKKGVSIQEFVEKDEAIVEILKSLYTFLTSVYGPEVNFRICLAKMGVRHVEDYMAYVPRDKGPNTEIETLKDDDALFSLVKKRKRAVVVEDIEKEVKKGRGKRNYIPNPDDHDDDDKKIGAIVGIPIRHTEMNEVPYVLTIEASKPKFFLNKTKKDWATVFNSFTQRIALEHFIRKIVINNGQGGSHG